MSGKIDKEDALNFILDTNVIIGYLNLAIPEKGIKLIDQLVDVLPIISVISKIEVLGFNFTDKEDEICITEFVNGCISLDVTNSVIEKAILVRKLCKIKLPDAIIAATALTHNLTLITRNTYDFTKIPELKLLNPFDL